MQYELFCMDIGSDQKQNDTPIYRQQLYGSNHLLLVYYLGNHKTILRDIKESKTKTFPKNIFRTFSF